MITDIEEEYGGELDFTRKYRPERFEDYIGNNENRERLYTQLQRGYFPRKIGFVGYTGSGKTTLARIMVREYLCPNRDPVMGACGEDDCYFCPRTSFYVKTGNFQNLPDIRELDLGQDGGKEVSQDIKAWIDYPPEDSDDFKIIVIDEAHNGTRSFWEANLKWIEDPPSYLVVFLATTDPEKIPDTVLNRFNEIIEVQRPSISELVGRLAYVCEQEGIAYDTEALRTIAQSSNQVIRSALHKLEGAFKTYGHVYTDEVNAQEKTFKDELLANFLKAYIEEDFPSYFHALDVVSERGNLRKFLQAVIDYTIRGIKISNNISMDSMTTAEIKEYKEFFKRFSIVEVAVLLKKLQDAQSGDTELKLISMIYSRFSEHHNQGTAEEQALPTEKMVEHGNSQDILLRARSIKNQNIEKTKKGIAVLEEQAKPVSEEDISSIFALTKVESGS